MLSYPGLSDPRRLPIVHDQPTVSSDLCLISSAEQAVLSAATLTTLGCLCVLIHTLNAIPYWWTTRGSNPPSQVCKTRVTPLRLLAHKSHSLIFNEEKGVITSIGASRENRTHTILITSQAQYHCAREAYKLVRMDRTLPRRRHQGHMCT